MHADADAWFVARTSTAEDWPVDVLLERKGDTRVSVVLPALDEEATVGRIVESIRKATDIMGEIASASAEQTTGIGHVNDAIHEMNSVTQQNAALVEEASASAQALQDQAGHLEQVVGIFKIEGMTEQSAAQPIRLSNSATALRLGTGRTTS